MSFDSIVAMAAIAAAGAAQESALPVSGVIEASPFHFRTGPSYPSRPGRQTGIAAARSAAAKRKGVALNRRRHRG